MLKFKLGCYTGSRIACMVIGQRNADSTPSSSCPSEPPASRVQLFKETEVHVSTPSSSMKARRSVSAIREATDHGSCVRVCTFFLALRALAVPLHVPWLGEEEEDAG